MSDFNRSPRILSNVRQQARAKRKMNMISKSCTNCKKEMISSHRLRKLFDFCAKFPSVAAEFAALRSTTKLFRLFKLQQRASITSFSHCLQSNAILLFYVSSSSNSMHVSLMSSTNLTFLDFRVKLTSLGHGICQNICTSILLATKIFQQNT